MATQAGILGIRGTVGGLVFAKDGSIRQKPASNKAAFNSAASLARTRENASEFGRAAAAGKLLRDSLRVLIAAASDAKMVSRLTQRMRAIIGMDEANDRGQRVVDTDNAKEQLLGFNFNLAAGIGQSLFFQYAVTGQGADVTMRIPSLNPQTDIVAPQGATHFEVLYGASAVNFETGTYQVASVAAPLGILALNSAPLQGRDLVATLPAAPTADELVVAAVGINFYQQLNGKNYPLNNNGTNPLAIEYVG